MHPILRIFVYHYDASLFVLGQCGPYGQGAVGSGHEHLQHYAVSTMQYNYQLLPSVTVSYATPA